jgi:branched-chain amino acid transport system substrate-binding protein
MKTFLKSLQAIAAFALIPLSAQAQQTIRIGLILPMSGPFADCGNQINNGIKPHIARNGNIPVDSAGTGTHRRNIDGNAG